MSLKWTPERVKQLNLLQNLVNEATRINSANQIGARLEFMETAAEKLSDSDAANLKLSFMDFLVKLCLDARTQEAKESKQ